jgi:hypothetical protein
MYMHLHFAITLGKAIMSLHIVRSLNRPLPLISAAFLIHIGGAMAAEPGGEVQQQMRDVLAGRVVAQSVQPSERREDSTVRPDADVLDLARQLLQGTDGRAHGIQAETRPENAESVQPDHRGLLARDDAQAMARRLLSQPNTVAAGT